MDSPSEQCVFIDGRPINFIVYGSGPKNVLCLSGTLGTWKMDFGPVLHKFDPAIYTVVVWDPPGYGKSRPPRRHYIAQVCRNDAQLALQLMRTPYAVFGWSEGGRTSFHLADMGPDDVICGVEWGGVSGISPQSSRYFKLIQDVNTWPPERRQMYEEIYEASELATIWREQCLFYVNTFEKVPGGSLPCRKILPFIRQPFLIINGMKDRFMAEPSKYIADKIPNARYVTHDEGGHNIHIEQKDWFFEVVFDFFDQVWK
uniref:AB hydrolase-1 domain-containing protein n=1 Tax=Plectus sambesii TaxID=2011161 RepID=A0A914W584_9BILA